MTTSDYVLISIQSEPLIDSVRSLQLMNMDYMYMPMYLRMIPHNEHAAANFNSSCANRNTKKTPLTNRRITPRKPFDLISNEIRNCKVSPAKRHGLKPQR